MKERLIQLLFPANCPVCGEIVRERNALICKDCRREVLYITEPKCQKCGKSVKEGMTLCKDCRTHKHIYEKGVCVFAYAGAIKESIYRFKYKNMREYGAFYGKEATMRYGKQLEKWAIDAMVAVPIHKKKERSRGYNQAEVFATNISKNTGIPLIKKCLVRVEDTIPQKELVGIQRKQNLENAFAIYEEKIQGCKNILVVDDIYTTGSTIDACAEILKSAGVQKVYFLCISAGVR